MDDFQSPFNNTGNNESHVFTPPVVSEEHVEQSHPIEENAAAPKKKRKSPRHSASAAASHEGVSPDTVSAILKANEQISRLSEDERNLLKLLVDSAPTSAYPRFVSDVVNNKTMLAKNLASEQTILDNLDDPFKTAFELAALERGERLKHWNRLAAVDIDAAKAVAGTNDGKWKQSWRDAQPESQAVYSLYLRIRDNYKGRLAEIKRTFE